VRFVRQGVDRADLGAVVQLGGHTQEQPPCGRVGADGAAIPGGKTLGDELVDLRMEGRADLLGNPPGGHIRGNRLIQVFPGHRLKDTPVNTHVPYVGLEAVRGRGNGLDRCIEVEPLDSLNRDSARGGDDPLRSDRRDVLPDVCLARTEHGLPKRYSIRPTVPLLGANSV